MSEQLLTTEDLATLLNVSLAVVYGLRYRGEAPPAIRIGRELRFRRADIDAWLELRVDDGQQLT